MLAVLSASVSAASALGALDRSVGEYQVKAAYLYNLAKFVEWPSSAFETPDAPLVRAAHGGFSPGGREFRFDVSVFERPARPWVGIAFVAAIGLYDGFVGPGTGMFLFWALTTWFALPALEATGTTKAGSSCYWHTTSTRSFCGRPGETQSAKFFVPSLPLIACRRQPSQRRGKSV